MRWQQLRISDAQCGSLAKPSVAEWTMSRQSFGMPSVVRRLEQDSTRCTTALCLLKTFKFNSLIDFKKLKRF